LDRIKYEKASSRQTIFFTPFEEHFHANLGARRRAWELVSYRQLRQRLDETAAARASRFSFLDTTGAMPQNFHIIDGSVPSAQQRTRKEKNMFSRQRNFILASLAMASTYLIGCGSPANPPPPKWTVENQNAPRSAPQKTAQAPAREATSASSLDSLQSGRSTATPASSPLKDALFGFDRYELSDDARAALKTNAEWLKANPSARVQIEGHCDERGAEDYNMALGAKRAQAAMDFMATLGIPKGRLSTVSYGEEVPSCKEHVESCWEKNRRARLVIVPNRPAS
jgi:peptidoglycan-associated lipoprotein